MMSDDAMQATMDSVQVYPPYRHAVQAYFEARYVDGEVVPHAWFYAQFGLMMPTPTMTVEEADKIELQRLAQMSGFKDVMLREHCRAIRNHPGKGYAVVPVQEQTAWAMREHEQELRKVAERLIDLVTYVRLDELTVEQRAANADARVKAAAIRHMLSVRGLRQYIAQSPRQLE